MEKTILNDLHNGVNFSSINQTVEKYDLDPRKLIDLPQLDLTHNNPLSQQETSPWRQYFIDVELKGCIKQDVERTFPELAYFQSDQVREMMIDILFIYARQNPHISYKQGMHEILGPLIFVMYSDQQSLSHALEQDEFRIENGAERRNLICTLINCKFLEHDAFQMFTFIMQIIQPWYYFGAESSSFNQKSAHFATELFCRPQDSGPTSALIRKLNFIGDILLQNTDHVLFNHLEKLEIPPQIYGIRWLRLLFGREFPIQDLLFLWDAIFAGGQPFLLVDYIFVAMLIFIRELIIGCDYTGCLHYLMRYPPVADVHSLLALALHLQDPKKYPAPKFSSQRNFSHITVAGRPHPNISNRVIENFDQSASPKRSADQSNNLLTAFVVKTAGDKNVAQIRQKATNYLNEIEGMSSNLAKNISSATTVVSPREDRSRSNSLKKRHKPVKQKSILTEEELDLLKEQVSCLQVRLNEVENESRSSFNRIKSLIGRMDERFTVLNVAKDDEARTLLSEMAQICTSVRLDDKKKDTYQQQQRRFNQNPHISVITGRHGNHANITNSSKSGTPPPALDPLINTPIEIGNDPTLSMITPSPTKEQQKLFSPVDHQTIRHPAHHKVILSDNNELKVIKYITRPAD